MAIPRILESPLSPLEKETVLQLLKSYSLHAADQIKELRKSYFAFFKNPGDTNLENRALETEKSTRAFVEAGMQVTFYFLLNIKTSSSRDVSEFEKGMSNLSSIKSGNVEFTQFPIIVGSSSFGKTEDGVFRKTKVSD